MEYVVENVINWFCYMDTYKITYKIIYSFIKQINHKNLKKTVSID